MTKSKRSFLACFAVGVLFMLCISYFAAEKGRAGWLLLGPVLAMVVHLLVVVRERVRSPFDVDSLYYLGFSFTLVSLVIAFGPLFWKVEGVSINAVIQAFGVALITTIIGLVARVILTSESEAGGGVERTEVEVNASLVGLREEIERTLRYVGQWRAETKSHWEGLRREEIEAQERFLGTGSEMSARALKATGEVVDHWKNTNLELAKEQSSRVLEVVNDAMAGFQELLVEAKRKLVKASGELGEALVREVSGFLGAEREILREEMERISQAARQHGKDLESAASEAALSIIRELSAGSEEIRRIFTTTGSAIEEEMQRVSRAARKATVELNGLSEQVAEVTDKNRNALEGIEKVLDKGKKNLEKGLGSMVSSLEGVGSELERMNRRFSEEMVKIDSTSIEKQLASLGGTLDKVEGQIGAVGRSHESAARRIDEATAKLAGSNGELASVLETYKKQVAMMEGLPATLRSSTADMVENVRVSQEALREVMQALSEGVATLRREFE